MARSYDLSVRRLALIATLPLFACGDDLLAPPTVIEAHGVRATVTTAPARIEIVRLSDGEVLLDTLPGSLAFRDATPEIEFQTGTFRIEDDRTAPWTEVDTLPVVRASADRIEIELHAGGRAIGRGAVQLAEGDVTVEIEATIDANRASLATGCVDGEHLAGLGGQSFDVDHRGQTVPLWVEEDGITKRTDDDYAGIWFLTGRRHSTHTPMPMMLSSRGFAAAVDTPARAVFALCSDPADQIRLETWEDRLALHLFVPEAADPAGAVGLMTAWVGRPRVPPRFAFAPWLDAIYGSDEVRRIADRLRAEDVAVSVIWTEDWRGGNDEGTGYVLEEDWRVDRDLYPDFEALAGDLHDDGYKFLVYHNTFVDSEADVFDEAIDLGHTIHDAAGEPYLFEGVKFRPATLLDLTSPEAVAWGSAVQAEAIAAGADGWMADFAEWLPHDAALASGEDPMLHHNRYPVEWARMNRALLDGIGDGVERLTFLRAAWLGSQPLVDVLWGGDQQTDFTEGDGMRSVIPIGIGLGVTGFPYYGHDIAGYMSEFTVPSSKELWLRWCTLGALSPVMRTHHGRSARQNWSWERDDETVAHLARWSRIHMQLVPYLAARAEEAAATGLPLMRLIALGWPELDWAWTATDEYLLGDRILVAPVLDEGATGRSVELPPGRWYPLLGGAPVDGGGAIDAVAPPTEIPAFVAEGSILVTYPAEVDTVVDAPGRPPTVTASEIGADRKVTLYGGAAARPALARHALDGAVYDWSGRDPDAGLPATATFDGADVPVTILGDLAVVEVSGPGVLTFEGGGALTMTGEVGATTVQLRP